MTLIGKKIIRIEEHPSADQGLMITLEDNTVLEIGYYADEGGIAINGIELDDMDILELIGEQRKG
jgi:hypothetical protein